MNKLRIGVRLGAAFAFILGMLLTSAVTALMRVQSLGDTAETLAGSRFQKAAAATSLRYYATEMTRLVRNIIILSGAPSSRPRLKRIMTYYRKKWRPQPSAWTGC